MKEYLVALEFYMSKGTAYKREETANGPPAHFIREWREKFNRSQSSLEADAGLGKGTISAYETNKNFPPVEAQQAIADALGIERATLMHVDPTKAGTLWHSFFRLSRASAAAQEQARKHIDAVLASEPAKTIKP